MKLIQHPNTTFDGYQPLKIKNQLSVVENLFAAIISINYKLIFGPIIAKDILERVFYIENDCKDILWD
ncbi:hypothetical protein [Clostridium sp.]|uniref:hypothetical protein n=1 Tax=Clostridium sp. TaxID=1506 RepID=UPI0039EA15E3